LTKQSSASGKVVSALLGNPFSFPEAWRTIAYFSSIFVFIPAIVVIMLITNEFTYKTYRQNIIDGWSRRDFMTGKLIDVTLISLLVTCLFAIVVLIIGFSNTTDPEASRWSLAYYVALFALQTFSQLSLAFLVGLFVKRSFIALAIFSFYFIIVEPILVNVIKYKFKSESGQFLPLEISQRLLPKPAFIGRIDEVAYRASLDAVKYHVAYTAGLVMLTWGICFWISKKRDL